MTDEIRGHDPTADSNGKSAPPPPVVPTIEERLVALESESRANREKKNSENPLDKVTAGEWWLVRIGAATLIVNFIIAFIYIQQLHQMTLATRASTDAVNIANDSLEENMDQFDLLNRQTALQTGAQVVSANAAKNAARTAQDTLVASNRPWLDINVVPASGLNYGTRTGPGADDFLPDPQRNDIHFYMSINIKNVGNSPAVNVQAQGVLYFKSSQSMFDEICTKLTTTHSGGTRTVFPGGKDVPLVAISDILFKDIPIEERGNMNIPRSNPGYIRPQIFACVAYQSTVEPRSVWHTTRIFYTLETQTRPGYTLALKFGERIPENAIHLNYALKSGN